MCMPVFFINGLDSVLDTAVGWTDESQFSILRIIISSCTTAVYIQGIRETQSLEGSLLLQSEGGGLLEYRMDSREDDGHLG